MNESGGRSVLWLDSCACPNRVIKVGNDELWTANNCDDSLDVFVAQREKIDAVIAELYVPQGKWDDDVLHEFPGLEFTARLKKAFGDKLRAAVFCTIVDEGRRDQIDGLAKSVGLVGLFDVAGMPFKQILDEVCGEAE